MSETEGIPDIHPDVPPSRAVLFQHYQQILDLVDQALHALSGKNIESFDEIKNIEKLYKNAKALLLEMEQTPGRDLVANKLLRIYQLMEKARHNLSVAEYNEKSHFLMSLLHQAERALENNETDKALRMYMHMKDIYACPLIMLHGHLSRIQPRPGAPQLGGVQKLELQERGVHTGKAGSREGV